MKVRAMIKLIENDGWYLDRTRGSHRQYRHHQKKGVVTIAGKPSDDLATRHTKQYSETGRIKMSRYLIVIEETDTGYSAYSPDLPGCVATGATRENVEREMHDAIEFHMDGLRRAGEPIPSPRFEASYCEVGA
jgi:predicted RNA binding protein YcfA (HicA-like mRNA interferase family)/predicted RNase H-like HicB family nuclease